MTVRKIAGEGLVLWPDGTWCYHEELREHAHMSDDYEVVPSGTPRWFEAHGQTSLARAVA